MHDVFVASAFLSHIALSFVQHALGLAMGGRNMISLLDEQWKHNSAELSLRALGTVQGWVVEREMDYWLANGVVYSIDHV